MPITSTRDRDATGARLIDAVEKVILSGGFGAVGINAVARQAGLDKVLIYRYFGGLPGLLAAYAERGDFWWRIEDLLAEPLPGNDDPECLAKIVTLIFDRHAGFLRTHPVTLEVIAWELSERNELTEALESVRESRSRELMVAVADRLGEDRASLIARLGPMLALLGAAANYLATRGRRLRLFNGVDLQSDKGWAELATVAGSMVAGALQPERTAGAV